MAELNLEDNILKLTLGDIVQSFSEEQLQTQMPIFMQDIDAETKDLIDTYQGYLVSGNFSEAETYRANNPALETRIWDAFKANSMMAYASYTYMYAKDQNQQCIFSSTEPEIRTMENDLGAVEGDIWFQYSSTIVEEVEVIDYAIPFNTYVLKDGVWCKFTVTPELDIATESDIEEIYNPEVVELTNPEALIDETGLKHFKGLIDSDLGETTAELEGKVGNLDQLLTAAKGSAVDAINEIYDSFSTAANDIGNAIVAVGGTVPEGATFAEMAVIIKNAMVTKNSVVGEAVSFSQSFSDAGDNQGYTYGTVGSYTLKSGKGVALMPNGAQVVCLTNIKRLSISGSATISCWSTDGNRRSTLNGYVNVNGTSKGKYVEVNDSGDTNTHDGPTSSTQNGTLTLYNLKKDDYITVSAEYGSFNKASSRFPHLSGTITVLELG